LNPFTANRKLSIFHCEERIALSEGHNTRGLKVSNTYQPVIRIQKGKVLTVSLNRLSHIHFNPFKNCVISRSVTHILSNSVSNNQMYLRQGAPCISHLNGKCVPSIYW